MGVKNVYFFYRYFNGVLVMLTEMVVKPNGGWQLLSLKCVCDTYINMAV